MELIKRLGLDFGNSSMKIVGGEGENIIQKRIKSLATTDSMDSNHIVEIGDKVVCFGIGTPLVTQDKTKREHLAHSILLATYEAYGPGSHVINLGTGLPIDLYKTKKDMFEKLIRDIGDIKGDINGNKVDVVLKDIKVSAEGLAAFKAIMPEIKKDENILIVDVGLRTTDVISASIENGKWKIDGYSTISTALYDCYDVLRYRLFDLTDVLLTPEQLEDKIINGGTLNEIDIAANYNICSEIVTDVFRRIQLKFNDLYARKVYFLGGGAELFNTNATFIKNKDMPKSKDKQIYSNAVGYYLSI